MNTVIYYFSGTGNSYVVARDIAKELNGVKIPVVDIVNENKVIPDFDIIGIVFPVYNAVVQGMPVMVKNFAEKLENINSKYVFVICTCLGWSYKTITKFDKILNVKGGKLSAGFTVIMPDNSSPVSARKQEKIFNNWAKKREVISQYVKSKKRGRYENPTFLNLIMTPFISNGKKKTLFLYRNLANDNDLSYEEAVKYSDRSFKVNCNCNGCGICANICPANDIQIIEGRPVWLNHCESCLACINWCPQEAITGGIVSIDKSPTGYHHPDIKVSNMLLRN